MTAFTVATAGLATVQDLGRAGQAHVGISPNGAADAYSARVANVIVGNAAGAALVEATASAFAATAHGELLVAVTGAADHVVVDGARMPAWEPIVVPAGATVSVPAPRVGRRTYLAVNGTLAADRILGSVAPDHLLGIGRRLRAGDTVEVASAVRTVSNPHLGVSLFHLAPARPRLSHELVVEVTPGPDADQFDGAVWDDGRGPFEVGEHSDHVGLRLRGPAPVRAAQEEILSRGVPTGTVEVPPAGGLIVLLRGRFLTAGYPVLAVATSVAVDRLGQVAPGDRLSFKAVSTETARAALRAREDTLLALAARSATALASVGLAGAIDDHHPGRAAAA